MTHRNNDRPFHISVADAKDIREGITAYYNGLEAEGRPDKYEYKASNDAEITFELGWDGYTLEMVDATRTYGFKMVFDELESIEIEEEFIQGRYDWIMTINGACHGNHVWKRIPLVDADRRGVVL